MSTFRIALANIRFPASHQPNGKHGLLIADIDIASATGLLAARCKSV